MPNITLAIDLAIDEPLLTRVRAYAREHNDSLNGCYAAFWPAPSKGATWTGSKSASL